jgi:hypothetical protein
MIVYDVSPLRASFIRGEEVQFRIHIINNGPLPFEFPDPGIAAASQPVHWLKSPDAPEPVRFTSRMRLQGETTIAPGTDEQLITVPAGGQWAHVFALNSVADVSKPGEYSFGSQLDWGDTHLHSEEKNFAITPMKIQSIAVGQGTLPFLSAEGSGAFIQESGAHRDLYVFGFREMRPSIGEAKAEKPIHRITVGPTATDVLLPWRNTPFFDELIQWVVWREGSMVRMLASNSTAPLSVEIPDGIGGFVQPAVKSRGGVAEVLVQSPDRRKITLLTFPHGEGEGFTARTEWQINLPEVPTEIRMALAPVASGSRRHIAFAVQHPDGISIFQSQYAAGGKPEKFESVELRPGKMLVNSPIAVFAGVDGVVHVSVIIVTNEQTHSCAIAEGTFDRSGKPNGPMTVKQLGSLPGVLVGGTQFYVEKEGAVGRHDVVIAIEGNRLFRTDGEGEMVPVSEEGMPIKPLILIPGKQSSYLLYWDINRGLYFEPI